jgi:hypothetical protein
MIIGILRIKGFLPSVRSLKEKRSIVRGLFDKIKNRFNVSVCETDFKDVLQRTEIAMGIIGNHTNTVDETLSRILEIVKLKAGLKILDYKKEFLSVEKF